MKIVILGGGTGVSNILTGLKNEYKRKIRELTSVITVADSGGSSGVLKKIFDIPAVGDLRNCLLALANIDTYMKKVLQYRFKEGVGLSGHPLGNLFLVALMETEGNFMKAIKKAAKILNVQGEVVPSTLKRVELIAKFEDGSIIKGEEEITLYGLRSNEKIISLKLVPENAKSPKEVIKKIKNADIILIGPGSLFTSILPNFLINDIKEAVNGSEAIKILIVNLLTQPGETSNFKASDHYYTFLKFSGLNKIDAVLINKEKPNKNLEVKIKEEKKEFVEPDIENIKGVGVYLEDLANKNDIYFKHDPLKLKRAIFRIAKDFNII